MLLCLDDAQSFLIVGDVTAVGALGNDRRSASARVKWLCLSQTSGSARCQLVAALLRLLVFGVVTFLGTRPPGLLSTATFSFLVTTEETRITNCKKGISGQKVIVIKNLKDHGELLFQFIF